MAITAKVDTIYEVANDYHLFGTITLDNAYPTNGYSLTGILKEFDTGAESVEWIRSLRVEPVAAGYVFAWDRAAQKLKVYRQKDPAAAGGADIALPEVANGADLSALSNQPFEAWAQ